MVFPRRILPNSIDTLTIPEVAGVLGLTPCPGARVMADGPLPAKVLEIDMAAIRQWGGDGVVCLLEPHELRGLGVPTLPDEVMAAGMWWKHLPIPDMGVPDQQFEDDWAIEGERIRHALREGERVVLHCFAGLGRTGMIAARLLVELGQSAESAVWRVRRSNPHRIQTADQKSFVEYVELHRDGLV